MPVVLFACLFHKLCCLANRMGPQGHGQKGPGPGLLFLKRGSGCRHSPFSGFSVTFHYCQASSLLEFFEKYKLGIQSILELASLLSHPNCEQRVRHKGAMLRDYLSSESVCRKPESKQVLGRPRVRVPEQWKHLSKRASSSLSVATVGACEGHGYTTMQYLPLSGSR